MTRTHDSIAAAAAVGFAGLVAAASTVWSQTLADHVYENGYLYTVDANDSVRSALAVRDGVIVFAGTDADARRWIGPRTEVEDLHGR